MSHYLTYLLLHYAFCLLLSILVLRPTFFTINRRMSQIPVTAHDLLAASRVGLKTDFAGSAYLTGLPLLTLWVCAYCNAPDVKIPLLICDGIVSIAIALAAVSDTVLYSYWRFRLDVSVFAYLRSLRGAMASVTTGYLALALTVVLVIATVIWGVFYGLGLLTGVYTAEIGHITLLKALAITGCFILAAGILFACIRGIKHRPNSPFQLYYSSNMYLNHTAVNLFFNLAYSASVKSKESNKFMIYDKAECDATVRDMLPTSGTPLTRLLKTKRPNILIIVWESLSAHFVEALGGKPGVTPHLNKLCDEGILFTHVDAGSWRTDPAMVCILSGYPAQPTTSIMRDTHKLPGLPALPRTLRDAGYHTSIVHGGPLSYMHMIDYYMVTGHDHIVGIDDMPADSPRCAWGVHDHYMFDWLFDDISRRSKDDAPWCTTFLTLSSHQPYIVPYDKLDDQIDNSYAYTDEAFGRFIDRLRQTPVWDDTLIVVMGDHGINLSFLPQPRYKQPHIPMLMLGGAIKGPLRIDTIVSQCDFAATLLGQLDLPHDHFIFSRDVLADTYRYPFTINIYNNGFLYRDASGYTEFDNVAERAVDSPDEQRERRGRMYMQYMMDDLSKR